MGALGTCTAFSVSGLIVRVGMLMLGLGLPGSTRARLVFRGEPDNLRWGSSRGRFSDPIDDTGISCLMSMRFCGS